MLGGMGSNMTQQLAGLMGMQGMGMQGMVSMSSILVTVFNHDYSFIGWDGRWDADEQFTAVFDVGWHAWQIHADGGQGDDGGGHIRFFKEEGKG